MNRDWFYSITLGGKRVRALSYEGICAIRAELGLEVPVPGWNKMTADQKRAIRLEAIRLASERPELIKKFNLAGDVLDWPE